MLRGEAFRRVASRGDDRARDDNHSWTGDNALIDRLFEPDVGVSGAFGAEVTYRRPAGHERGARMIDGPRDAQRQRLV